MTMGSAEFEFGACPLLSNRIFARGLSCFSTTVQHEGKEIPVYVVAGTGFSVPEYQPHLQQMSGAALRLKERTVRRSYQATTRH